MFLTFWHLSLFGENSFEFFDFFHNFGSKKLNFGKSKKKNWWIWKHTVLYKCNRKAFLMLLHAKHVYIINFGTSRDEESNIFSDLPRKWNKRVAKKHHFGSIQNKKIKITLFSLSLTIMPEWNQTSLSLKPHVSSQFASFWHLYKANVVHI